jgi:putative phage-type endonuclease
MAIVHTMEQGTDAWFAARVGKATASRVADIVARTKSGPSASRANYLAELVCERMTGQKAQGFVNAAMQHGIDTEAEARAAYAFLTGNQVEEVGFVDHPAIPSTGASPDGLVGDDGLLEIKCPNTATHIDTLLNGTIADKYHVQMQWQMACTERQWCDFVSYDPRMREGLQIFVQRVPRDEARIADLQAEVAKFTSEVDATIDRLNGLLTPANDTANLLMAG